MLTTNFNLLRKSGITKKYDYNVLVYVFVVFYIDMYDLALFAGYAIYLSRVILPVYDVYKCLLIFSCIFLLTQVAKFCGFLYYFLSKKNDSILKYSIVFLTISYLVLIVFPTYSQFGITAFIFFIFFRLMFSFALGCEIGTAIKFTNDLSLHDISPDIYYFIWLAGELGIFISMFINRMTVLHYFSAISYEHSWRIQFAINSCLLLYSMYNKYQYNIYSTKNLFTRSRFINLVKKDWQYIIVRSITYFYSVLLILAVVIRAPRNMELIFGLSPSEINHKLIVMSILGFLGANSITIVRNYISAYYCLLILFIMNVALQTYVWQFDVFINLEKYVYYIYYMAFFYGAFLRITPEVLNKSICFDLRTHIIGRFMSYMIAYGLLIALTEFLFDYSHYKLRYVHDGLAILITAFFALAGTVGLIIFKKHYV